jgi:hypothetical protein
MSSSPNHIFYENYRKGTFPSAKPCVDTMYWSGVFRTALDEMDVKTFEVALEYLLLTVSSAPDGSSVWGHDSRRSN